MNKLIYDWKSKNYFRLYYLTQQDKGFRKNKILNESIRRANKDYLIFLI
ncbi:MAG: hypothetical protein IPH77_06070 [Ignavibacteria bacterium]|nr:hypothetical protein [Ignavibacteria bacterium]